MDPHDYHYHCSLLLFYWSHCCKREEPYHENSRLWKSSAVCFSNLSSKELESYTELRLSPSSQRVWKSRLAILVPRSINSYILNGGKGWTQMLLVLNLWFEDMCKVKRSEHSGLCFLCRDPQGMPLFFLSYERFSFFFFLSLPPFSPPTSSPSLSHTHTMNN